MFSRKKHADDAHAPAEEPAVPTASGKKGRPTPTRKQAQARNNRPLVPADRKEAKRRASQALNARFRAEQEALITGDEQHLPARDKGRVRRFVRDWVDARWSFGEFVMPLILLSLVLVMVLSAFADRMSLQVASGLLIGSTILMYGSFVVVILESTIVWRRIRKRLAERYPGDEIPRGTWYYCFSRMLFLRRWRSPRPQVARGEFPKTKKK